MSILAKTIGFWAKKSVGTKKGILQLGIGSSAIVGRNTIKNIALRNQIAGRMYLANN